MIPQPTIVVPAAGFGSRFGGPVHKLDQPFADSTVLGTTVQHALASGLPLMVVTTADLAPSVLRWVGVRQMVVLSADEAARGMGASIAAGVAESSDAAGWVVLPGDMPLVQPATLLAVAQALQEYAVAYAQYRGRRGHPVAFAAELYSELVMLNGDDGARRIVARYPAYGQDVDDRGALLDIDSAADLQALQELHRRPIDART